MRCRECGKAFDQWSWENPVCPECLEQAGDETREAEASAAPGESDGGSVLAESTPDDLSIGSPIESESVEDILESSLTTPSFGELNAGDETGEGRSPLMEKIEEVYSGVQQYPFESLISPESSVGKDTSPPAIVMDPIKFDERLKEDDSFVSQSDILGEAPSDILGAGMPDAKLDEFADKFTVDDAILTGSTEEDFLTPGGPEESFFHEDDFDEAIEKAFSEKSEPPPLEDGKIYTADRAYEEVISTGDLLDDDIAVIVSSEKIPEAIPVAKVYSETVDVPLEEFDDIAEGKGFFHSDDDFHAGTGAPADSDRDSYVAHTASVEEMRSEIRTYTSPGGRYSIDFAEGKFLRMVMEAEGANGWNMTVAVFLLLVTMITAGTGFFFFIILPFILIQAIRVTIRIFASEKLYVDGDGIRHEVVLAPGLSVNTEKPFTPKLYVFKSKDPFRYFRARDKHKTRKEDMLFLSGDDWQTRVGFLTDESESRWLYSHLGRFLRKIQYVN